MFLGLERPCWEGLATANITILCHAIFELKMVAGSGTQTPGGQAMGDIGICQAI
jgi:hypothetical protein